MTEHVALFLLVFIANLAAQFAHPFMQTLSYLVMMKLACMIGSGSQTKGE